MKNEEDRLVVLNRVARSVVESVRGQHRDFVFVRTPKAEHGADPLATRPAPVQKMNATAWKGARVRAADKWEKRTGEPVPDGFRRVRFTISSTRSVGGFARLVALHVNLDKTAGVSFEDRQDLLGHKSGRISTHYSAAELANLMWRPRRSAMTSPTNLPQSHYCGGERDRR